MNKIMTLMLAGLLLLPFAGQFGQAEAKSRYKSRGKSDKVQFSRPQHSFGIYDGHYFTYSWDKAPGKGTRVLYLNVYDKKGRLSDDFVVTAFARRPGVPGRALGHQKMKLNGSRQFAIPLSFSDTGKWEVELKFAKEGLVRNTMVVKLDI